MYFVVNLLDLLLNETSNLSLFWFIVCRIFLSFNIYSINNEDNEFYVNLNSSFNQLGQYLPSNFEFILVYANNPPKSYIQDFWGVSYETKIKPQFIPSCINLYKIVRSLNTNSLKVALGQQK